MIKFGLNTAVFASSSKYVGLQGDNDKINLKRISATQAIAIKKAWTCIEDDQLKDTVFTWEAPLEATHFGHHQKRAL